MHQGIIAAVFTALLSSFDLRFRRLAMSYVKESLTTQLFFVSPQLSRRLGVFLSSVTSVNGPISDRSSLKSAIKVNAEFLYFGTFVEQLCLAEDKTSDEIADLIVELVL